MATWITLPKISPYCLCLEPLTVFWTTKFWKTVVMQASSIASESRVPSRNSSLRKASNPSRSLYISTAPDQQNNSSLSKETSDLDPVCIFGKTGVQAACSASELVDEQVLSNSAHLHLYISDSSLSLMFFISQSFTCVISSALVSQSSGVNGRLLQRILPYPSDWKTLSFDRCSAAAGIVAKRLFCPSE